MAKEDDIVRGHGGASDGAIKAFANMFSAGAGVSGYRAGSNSITAELAMKREALTRIALVVDITGSRRKTQRLLKEVFTQAMQILQDLVGNVEFHPIYMTGGATIAQEAFTTAAQATRALNMTGIKNGSTSYMDVLKVLKTKIEHLKQDFPEDTLLREGHPELRLRHADFDAVMMFPDRFEDKAPGASEDLNSRYAEKAEEFLEGWRELGIPTFVFHEKTTGVAGYTSQVRDGFEPLASVFAPASITATNGSFLSFDEYDKPNIMGGIIASGIIMLGGDENTVKHIMEEELVKELIASGDLDPRMIEDLRGNNPQLLLPDYSGDAPNTDAVIAL